MAGRGRVANAVAGIGDAGQRESCSQALNPAAGITDLGYNSSPSPEGVTAMRSAAADCTTSARPGFGFK